MGEEQIVATHTFHLPSFIKLGVLSINPWKTPNEFELPRASLGCGGWKRLEPVLFRRKIQKHKTGPIKWSRRKFTPVTNIAKKKKNVGAVKNVTHSEAKPGRMGRVALWERGWVGGLRRTSGKSYLLPRVCVTNPLHLRKQIKEQEALGCCLGGGFYLWVEVADSGTNWFHLRMDSYRARLA